MPSTPTPLRPLRRSPCTCCGRFVVVLLATPAGSLTACLNCDSWAGCGAHNQGRFPGMEPIEKQDEQPTPQAEALHGDRAAVETHEQPPSVALDGDTRVQTGEPVDDED